MAEQRKRYGGAGNRNPNRKAYDGHIRPQCTRPLPADFREEYIRTGWDAQYWYGTNWRVMVRWIEEAGGDELRAARREYLRKNGFNRIAHVQHAKGWDAEKLKALHQREATSR